MLFRSPDGVDEKEYREMLCEQMRCHELAMSGDDITSEEIYRRYDELPDVYKDKDNLPFNSMLQLVRKFDGLRIYQFSSDSQNQADHEETVGGR